MFTVPRLSVLLGVLFLAAGCRTATRITEVPRVDLELSSTGNRGYLIGQAPEAAGLKTTRQMIETDVEIPSYYRPKPRWGQPSDAQAAAGGFSGSGEPSTAVSVSSGTAEPGPMDTYVVQKGDTLSGIAAKPQIYGKASKWKRILDANQELLKGNPNHIRAGMKLNIPRGQSDDMNSSAGEDSGTTFKK